MVRRKVWTRALAAICLLALGAVVVVLAGTCAGTEEPQVDPLVGTEWQVGSYYDARAGKLMSPLAGTQLTAKWEGGQVSGSSGCNTYSALYTIDGESLTVQAPASTMMACADPAGVMDQEQQYLAALQLASTFAATGTQLQVFGSDGNVVLVFSPYTGPLPTTAPAPAEATATTAAGGGVWERIQSEGVIRAGTSPDYPPFEYLRGPDLVGFDIDLMDEIGEQMGVTVEYTQMKFEDLWQALLDGTIDVAVAAITYTPERAESADFSHSYYTDRPAALVAEGSLIRLDELEDVAKYRVGVQNNTVFEETLRDWIEKGSMPEENLATWPQVEEVIDALKNGEIDLAVMDHAAAQAFVQQDGIVEAGAASSPEYFSLALPKGETELKARIDEAIKTFLDDGTILDLCIRHGLGNCQEEAEPEPVSTPVSTPEPTAKPGVTATAKPRPTATKTPTPKPQATAVPQITFTLDDDHIVAGESTWARWGVDKVKNVYFYIKGEDWANKGVAGHDAREVRPAQTTTYVLRVQFNDGTYKTEERTLTVDRAPVITRFSVEPGGSISLGQVYTIKWETDGDISKARLYANGEVVSTATDATITHAPVSEGNVRYELVVEGPGGRDSEYTDRFVNPRQEERPVIDSFDVQPRELPEGDRVTVTWRTSGGTRHVVVWRDDQRLIDTTSELDGSLPDTPPPESHRYVLEAWNNVGVVEKAVIDIYVHRAQPVEPQIVYFSVEPQLFPLGGTVEIRWEVEGDVSSVAVFADTPVSRVHLSNEKRGNMLLTPDVVGDWQFFCMVTWAGGDKQEVQEITVVQPY